MRIQYLPFLHPMFEVPDDEYIRSLMDSTGGPPEIHPINNIRYKESYYIAYCDRSEALTSGDFVIRAPCSRDTSSRDQKYQQIS